jgi:hypothetical protein
LTFLDGSRWPNSPLVTDSVTTAREFAASRPVSTEYLSFRHEILGAMSRRRGEWS